MPVRPHTRGANPPLAPRVHAAAATVKPTPIVKIDNISDPFATVVTVEFGDKAGDLLETVSAPPLRVCAPACPSQQRPALDEQRALLLAQLGVACPSTMTSGATSPLYALMHACMHACEVSFTCVHGDAPWAGPWECVFDGDGMTGP